jgi:hypothetical protein
MANTSPDLTTRRLALEEALEHLRLAIDHALGMTVDLSEVPDVIAWAKIVEEHFQAINTAPPKLAPLCACWPDTCNDPECPRHGSPKDTL